MKCRPISWMYDKFGNHIVKIYEYERSSDDDLNIGSIYKNFKAQMWNTRTSKTI